MKAFGTFLNMPSMNLAALVFFITAKLFGIVGVSLGFLGSEYLRVGGASLCVAFLMIFLSISCSLVQTSRDRKIFEKEDYENFSISSAQRQKMLLQEEIKELELKKKSLENFIVRRT